MGRKAKRKAERRVNIITIAGEQGEVFDEQMNSDHEWFKGSNQPVRFRPEISGEFNDYLMLGYQPPSIESFGVGTGKDNPITLDWVCVVDISRATEDHRLLGARIRLRCPAPLSGQLRQALADYAIRYAQIAVATLKL